MLQINLGTRYPSQRNTSERTICQLKRDCGESRSKRLVSEKVKEGGRGREELREQEVEQELDEKKLGRPKREGKETSSRKRTGKKTRRKNTYRHL